MSSSITDGVDKWNPGDCPRVDADEWHAVHLFAIILPCPAERVPLFPWLIDSRGSASLPGRPGRS